jgi:hypothetical protein
MRRDPFVEKNAFQGGKNEFENPFVEFAALADCRAYTRIRSKYG